MSVSTTSDPGPVHTVGPIPRAVTAQLRRGGWLEDPRLAVAVFLIAGGLLLGWIVVAWHGHRLGRKPSHPVLRRLGLSGSLVLLVFTGSLLAINSYAGYLPTFGALRDLLTDHAIAPWDTPPPMATVSRIHGDARVPKIRAGGGVRAVSAAGPAWIVGATPSRLVALSIGASRLQVRGLTTYVYLPPGYDSPAEANRRYPVVYLIHGYPGSSADWLRAGQANQAMDLLLADHLVGPMILVMPDANGGWLHDSECLNAVHGAQIETYLTSTVVAAIDQRFRTLADRTGRAIGGMSSGGYCALNLGLRHTDTYSVILASEPYGDPGRNVIGSELGGSRTLFLANSPSHYVSTMAFAHPVAVFLDAGSGDAATAPAAISLARELTARGQYVALRLAPGLHHTWQEARVELPYSLTFAHDHLTPTSPQPYPQS